MPGFINGVRHVVGTDQYDIPSDSEAHAASDAQQALDAAQIAADGALGDAKDYVDAGDAATLAEAKSHADAGDVATLQDAKDHADAGDATTLASAKDYTDTEIAGVDSRRWNKAAPLAGVSANSITIAGSYPIQSDRVLSLPNGTPNAGNLTVLPVGGSGRIIQTWQQFGDDKRIWNRWYNGASWSPWTTGVKGDQLGAATHLDTITRPGNYWQPTSADASAANGYPFPVYGNLVVYSQHDTDVNVTQIYYPSTRFASGFAMRSLRTDGWTPWDYYENTRGAALTTEDLDTITRPGTYWQQASANATTARHYPFPIYGTLVVQSQHGDDVNVTQVYTPSAHYAEGQAIRSYRPAQGWTAWATIPTMGQVDNQIAQVRQATSSAGMKSVPLALGLGFGSDYGAPAACTYRIPINYAPDIPRFRIHIRNGNPRNKNTRAGSAHFNGIWYGQHAGDGAFTATPTRIAPAFDTPADGSDWVSDWISVPLGGGADYLLSFAYTYTGTPGPYFTAGGSWRDDTTATLGATVAPTSLVRENLIPFDVWIEAETYATTPVVAAFGDSLSAGIGADFTVYDSWVSQYARSKGALPVHYAIGGTQMGDWGYEGLYAWNRWAGLARPDAVVWAMGSNDIFSGTDLATLKSRHAAVAPLLASKVCERIYAATIMPRSNASGAPEDVRRLYNTWLRTLPNGVRDLFDFAASISGDDETIKPEYDSDGTHLNTAGYAQNALAVVRPIMAPAPLYA